MAHAPPPVPLYHQHDHQHDNNIMLTPHNTSQHHITTSNTDKYNDTTTAKSTTATLFQQTILFNDIKYHSLNKFNSIDNNFTHRVNFFALFSDTTESFANSAFSSCWKTKYRYAQIVKY